MVAKQVVNNTQLGDEFNHRDGLEATESSHHTQQCPTATARDWEVLIQSSDDEKAILAILYKRQLTFESLENQPPTKRSIAGVGH